VLLDEGLRPRCGERDPSLGCHGSKQEVSTLFTNCHLHIVLAETDIPPQISQPSEGTKELFYKQGLVT